MWNSFCCVNNLRYDKMIWRKYDRNDGLLINVSDQSEIFLNCITIRYTQTKEGKGNYFPPIIE